MLRKLAANPYLRVLVLLGFLAAVVLGFVAWKAGVDRAVVVGWWEAMEAFLRERPLLLFAALVILPGLPVPISALLFLTGTVWDDQPALACFLGLAGLLGNVAWTYAVAAGPGRRLVGKILTVSGIELPGGLDPKYQTRMILILRLTPGVPMFFQNYLLGFLHVKFVLNLVLALVCNGIVACGVILTGAGFSDGISPRVVGGASLIVVGMIVVQLIRGKLRQPAANYKNPSS